MKPMVRHALWHAARAARWHSQPFARNAATMSTNAAAHAVSSSDVADKSELQPQQTHKTDTSTKDFNLFSGGPTPLKPSVATKAAAATASGGAAFVKDKRYRKKKTKKSKWWTAMDRVSFRTLLTEEITSSKVSSVLRKFMDEFPILNNNWSDQELVMIVCTLIKMNRSAVALDVLRNQIVEANCDRINRVAAASARLGNAQVALGVLEIARQFNMAPDVITYTSAIHACARGGRYDMPMALTLLNEMITARVKPNARTYGAAVLAFARMDRWEDIEELVSSIPYSDDAQKTEVFTCAIISCSRNRQYGYASRLFELLLEDGAYPGDNVCNAALSACARTSDLTQLHRIFKLVERHTTPSIYSFNCMISAFGTARNLDDALGVLETIRSSPTVNPDVVTFNALLLAAVRSRRVDMIPFILSLMAESGKKWDEYTLNMLLEGCVLTGDVEMANHYWAQATQGKEANADQSSAELQNVVLDRTHFETLMNVYYTAKDYAAILDLWQNNKTCRRRAKSSKSLNFLIRACEGLKDDGTAVKLLGEFENRGQPLSSITHNHMLSVFLAANKYPDALAYLHKMMDEEGVVSTFSFMALMKYLVKEKCHSDVLSMFDLYLGTREGTLKRQNPFLHYPSDAIYVVAMRSAVELQDHETALAIYSDLPATMSMAIRKELLALAISSCEHESDWRGAVTMYDEMTGKLDEETNVEMYKHIVKIVASAGEFDRALDVGGGQWYRQNRPDQGWGI